MSEREESETSPVMFREGELFSAEMINHLRIMRARYGSYPAVVGIMRLGSWTGAMEDIHGKYRALLAMREAGMRAPKELYSSLLSNLGTLTLEMLEMFDALSTESDGHMREVMNAHAALIAKAQELEAQLNGLEGEDVQGEKRAEIRKLLGSRTGQEVTEDQLENLLAQIKKVRQSPPTETRDDRHAGNGDGFYL